MNIIRLTTLLVVLGMKPLWGMTSEEQLKFWRDALQTKDLSEINLRVGRANAEWPKIYSNFRQGYENEEARKKNEDFAELARDLFELIDAHANGLDRRRGSEIAAGLEELLRIRAWIAASPSYLNYALVDTINRHVLVRAMELLAEPSNDSGRVVRSLAVLADFRFDQTAWRTMLNEERNALASSEAAVFGVLENGDHQGVLERAGLKNFNEYKTRELLKGQYYFALGWRMVVMDYYLGSVVPVVLEYWKKAKSPTVADEYAKIRDVLGKDELVPESVGARFLERKRACAAVDDVFRETRRREIRRHIKLMEDGGNR